MKKFTLFALAAGICLASATKSFANPNLWQHIDGKTAPSAKPKHNLPSEYSILKLDQEGIKALLLQAGNTFGSGVNLSLPTPDGGVKTFKVWNTPVLEDQIQAQFPEIQTYTGSLNGDASQTVKISTGSMGIFIRTYSFDMNDAFAIEPYGYDADGYYTIASAKDFYHSPNAYACNPESISNPITNDDQIAINPTADQIAQRTIGSTRRTYRMALSCSGEYALSVAGTPNPTVSQILAIMTATINNANGVWERELSISMKLVNNNTAVIYLDPLTDPFFDDADHAGMIDTNQIVQDIFIGNGNYDIGHVFTQSGGGLAQLSAVCAPGSKARGQTGSSGPTDIGTVCHEVGHQLGAGHTFSSETGGCGGNISLSSAVEPGSGTTIMSYNGACGADNTPIFTTPMTDYYNEFNLKQMQSVLTTQGATCGTALIGQTPVMMTNIDKRYIIPGNCPFELISNEATNTVATNSAVTYCWEQADVAPAGMVEADGPTATRGPIFMSMPATTDKAREFPRYSQLAQNIYSSSGERLPAVARDMRYKVTARSIAQDGWGTNNTIDSCVNIKVVPGDLFRVNGPAANDLDWDPGTQHEVTWDVGNTLVASDSISTGFVNIYLSLDGGLSFPIILATNAPNTGSFTLTAPNWYTTQGRIKVKGVGNIFFDVSKTNFAVNGTLGVKGVDVANSLNVYPNPSNGIVNVENKNFKGSAMQMTLLNTLGQVIWKGTLNEKTSINTSSFAKGTYLLYFSSDKSAEYGVKKLVLQ